MRDGPTASPSAIHTTAPEPVTAAMHWRAKLLSISELTTFAKQTLPQYRVPPTTFLPLIC